MWSQENNCGGPNHRPSQAFTTAPPSSGRFYIAHGFCSLRGEKRWKEVMLRVQSIITAETKFGSPIPLENRGQMGSPDPCEIIPGQNPISQVSVSL
jgi:hypothetical protein